MVVNLQYAKDISHHGNCVSNYSASVAKSHLATNQQHVPQMMLLHENA